MNNSELKAMRLKNSIIDYISRYRSTIEGVSACELVDVFKDCDELEVRKAYAELKSEWNEINNIEPTLGYVDPDWDSFTICDKGELRDDAVEVANIVHVVQLWNSDAGEGNTYFQDYDEAYRYYVGYEYCGDMTNDERANCDTHLQLGTCYELMDGSHVWECDGAIALYEC